MLSMLFSCLELNLNSGYVTLLSRLAKDIYRRKPTKRDSTVAELWKAGNRTVRIDEESGDENRDHAADDDDEPPAEIDDAAVARGYRRGLALEASLRATGMVWLPDDMFS